MYLEKVFCFASSALLGHASEKETHCWTGAVPRQKSNESANCDEPMTWLICLLAETYSRPLSLPLLWQYHGIKTWLFIFISVIILPQNTSAAWFPCHLSLKTHHLWQYGRGLPQQLKCLESYSVAVFNLVHENLHALTNNVCETSLKILCCGTCIIHYNNSAHWLLHQILKTPTPYPKKGKKINNSFTIPVILK